jgi:hypothetical protein
MELCATCCQPITEKVVQGRKFIAKVPAGLNTPPGTGRYLTILNLTCACAVRIVRRYENRQSHEVNLPEYQLH